MKNKLTRLSITMLVGLVAFGAIFLLVNPFNLGASSAHSILGSAFPLGHNNNSPDQNSNGTSTGLSQTPPPGGSAGLSKTPTGGSYYGSDDQGEHHGDGDHHGIGYGDS